MNVTASISSVFFSVLIMNLSSRALISFHQKIENFNLGTILIVTIFVVLIGIYELLKSSFKDTHSYGKGLIGLFIFFPVTNYFAFLNIHPILEFIILTLIGIALIKFMTSFDWNKNKNSSESETE